MLVPGALERNHLSVNGSRMTQLNVQLQGRVLLPPPSSSSLAVQLLLSRVDVPSVSRLLGHRHSSPPENRSNGALLVFLSFFLYIIIIIELHLYIYFQFFGNILQGKTNNRKQKWLM